MPGCHGAHERGPGVVDDRELEGQRGGVAVRVRGRQRVRGLGRQRACRTGNRAAAARGHPRADRRARRVVGQPRRQRQRRPRARPAQRVAQRSVAARGRRQGRGHQAILQIAQQVQRPGKRRAEILVHDRQRKGLCRGAAGGVGRGQGIAGRRRDRGRRAADDAAPRGPRTAADPGAGRMIGQPRRQRQRRPRARPAQRVAQAAGAAGRRGQGHVHRPVPAVSLGADRVREDRPRRGVQHQEEERQGRRVRAGRGGQRVGRQRAGLRRRAGQHPRGGVERQAAGQRRGGAQTVGDGAAAARGRGQRHADRRADGQALRREPRREGEAAAVHRAVAGADDGGGEVQVRVHRAAALADGATVQDQCVADDADAVGVPVRPLHAVHHVQIRAVHEVERRQAGMAADGELQPRPAGDGETVRAGEPYPQPDLLAGGVHVVVAEVFQEVDAGHGGRVRRGHGQGEVERRRIAVGVGRPQRVGGLRLRRGRRTPDGAAVAGTGGRGRVRQPAGQRRRGVQAVGEVPVAAQGRRQGPRRDRRAGPVVLRRDGRRAERRLRVRHLDGEREVRGVRGGAVAVGVVHDQRVGGGGGRGGRRAPDAARGGVEAEPRRQGRRHGVLRRAVAGGRFRQPDVDPLAGFVALRRHADVDEPGARLHRQDERQGRGVAVSVRRGQRVRGRRGGRGRRTGDAAAGAGARRGPGVGQSHRQGRRHAVGQRRVAARGRRQRQPRDRGVGAVGLRSHPRAAERRRGARTHRHGEAQRGGVAVVVGRGQRVRVGGRDRDRRAADPARGRVEGQAGRHRRRQGMGEPPTGGGTRAAVARAREPVTAGRGRQLHVAQIGAAFDLGADGDVLAVALRRHRGRTEIGLGVVYRVTPVVGEGEAADVQIRGDAAGVRKRADGADDALGALPDRERLGTDADAVAVPVGCLHDVEELQPFRFPLARCVLPGGHLDAAHVEPDAGGAVRRDDAAREIDDDRDRLTGGERRGVPLRPRRADPHRTHLRGGGRLDGEGVGRRVRGGRVAVHVVRGERVGGRRLFARRRAGDHAATRGVGGPGVGQSARQGRRCGQTVAERAVAAAGGRQPQRRPQEQAGRVAIVLRGRTEGGRRVGRHGDGERQIRGVGVGVRGGQRIGGARFRRGRRAGDRAAAGRGHARTDGLAWCVIGQSRGQRRRGPQAVAECPVALGGRRQRQIDRRVLDVVLGDDGRGAERRHVAGNGDGEGQPRLVTVGVRGDQRVGGARAGRGRRAGHGAAARGRSVATDGGSRRVIGQPRRQRRRIAQAIGQRPVATRGRGQGQRRHRHALGIILRRPPGRAERRQGIGAGDGEREAGNEAVGVGRGQRVRGARQRRGRRAGDGAAARDRSAAAEGSARRVVGQPRRQRRGAAQGVGERSAARGRWQRLIDRGAGGVRQRNRGGAAERRPRRGAAAVHQVAGGVGDRVAAEAEPCSPAASAAQRGAVQLQGVRGDADAVGVAVACYHPVGEVQGPASIGYQTGLARVRADAERQRRSAAAFRDVRVEADLNGNVLADPVGVPPGGAAGDGHPVDRGARGHGREAAVHLVGGGVGDCVAAEVEVRLHAVRSPHAAAGQGQGVRGDADAVGIAVAGHHRVAEAQTPRRRRRPVEAGLPRRRADAQRQARRSARDHQLVEPDPHDDRVARGVRIAPARRAGRDEHGGDLGCVRARHGQGKGERGRVVVRVVGGQRVGRLGLRLRGRAGNGGAAQRQAVGQRRTERVQERAVAARGRRQRGAHRLADRVAPRVGGRGGERRGAVRRHGDGEVQRRGVAVPVRGGERVGGAAMRPGRGAPEGAGMQGGRALAGQERQAGRQGRRGAEAVVDLPVAAFRARQRDVDEMAGAERQRRPGDAGEGQLGADGEIEVEGGAVAVRVRRDQGVARLAR